MHNHRLFSTIVLLSCAFTAYSQLESTTQQRISWLKSNAIPLRSIDPSDEDFSDLLPLKDLLKDVRMVLLGEESHGDGSTFLAKTRLIKFLHAEMGFEVLVFESGYYDCWKGWQSFVSGEDITKAFRQSVWRLWSLSQQIEDLIDYIGRAHSRGKPLKFAGLDPSIIDSTLGESLPGDLRRAIYSLEIPNPQEQEVTNFLTMVQHLVNHDYRTGRARKPTAAEIDSFVSTATRFARAMESSSRLSRQDRSFWARVLENLAIDIRWLTMDFRNPDWALVNLRDIQMSRNVISLMRDLYPDRKFVVWSASLHIARNLSDVEVPDSALQAVYRKKQVMGDFLWRELQQEMYSLGFTAFEGEVGAWAGKPRKLEKPSPNSLEDLLAQAGLDNAILDLRHQRTGGEWLTEKLKSRPFGYSEMTARWNTVFDGIMFTKTMIPSTKSMRQ